MSQKNDNFIDKTFTVLADILLKVLPATQEEKTAFSYYRTGMSAQSSGSYAEALENIWCFFPDKLDILRRASFMFFALFNIFPLNKITVSEPTTK